MEIIISVCFFALIAATALVYRGVTAARLRQRGDKR